MVVDKTSFALPKDNYFQTKFPKTAIVLHYTAGPTAYSAYQAWAQPGKHVSTAYLVGPGKKSTDPHQIFQVFDPTFWGYHLAMTAENYNWVNDKRTIAIEICNPGQLVVDPKNPNQLNWWLNNFGTKWCTLDETTKYVKIATPYRGYTYFASFAPEQIQLVKELVKELTVQFNIPQVLPVNKYGYDPKFFSAFKGVASHVNFNAGKLDMNPSCDSWYNSEFLFS